MTPKHSKRPLHALRISRRMEVDLIKKYLQIQPDDRVCDIGCGDGYWTSRIVGNTLTVAIDIDPRSIELARTLRPALNVHYTLMSAEAMAVRDEAFTKIFGVCSLEHIPNNHDAFREFARCLAPGGVLALTCDSLSYPRTTEEQRANHHAKYFTPHLYTLDSIKDYLKAVGMEITDSKYIIATSVSHALYRLFDRVPRLQYATFPVSYPLITLADRFFSTNRYGWKLAIRAVKR